MELTTAIKIHGRITGLLPTSALFQGILADVPNNFLLCSNIRNTNYPRHFLCRLLNENRLFLRHLATTRLEKCVHLGRHGPLPTSFGHFHFHDILPEGLQRGPEAPTVQRNRMF